MIAIISQYLNSIYSAFIFFPILALIFTLPYLLYQYRKYGSVVIFRAVVVYSFILYLLVMYFLVVLPLPSFEEAAAGTGPLWQAHPLNCLRDIIAIEGFSPLSPSTYMIALRNGELWQVVFNIFLFCPLGMYLHYYFKRNWFQTILIAFTLSLFFELTQLTALYGIYPRPYRLFDVDDLLLNTFGALCGHIISPLFTWIFPKKESLNALSYARGQKVSPFRRLLAALVDWGIIGAIILLFGNFFNTGEILAFSWQNIILYIVLVFLYFMGLSYLLRGRTIGKMLVKLQITDDKEGQPKFYQYVIRYALLYYLCLPSLYVAMVLNKFSYTVTYSWAITILVGVFASIFFVFLFQALSSFFKGHRQLLHEKISHTKTCSLTQDVNYDEDC